jgi:hypothetical protein
MYDPAMLDDFEFWSLREGPDGRRRIGVRVSGQGRRESWLTPSEEAEGDVLKRWAAEHLERVGACVAMIDPQRSTSAT